MRRRQIKITVPVDTCEALKAYAVINGEPVGGMIRRLLRGYIRSRREREARGPVLAREATVDPVDPRGQTRSPKIWIDVDDWAALKTFAEAGDVSVGVLVRQLLLRHVAARQSRTNERTNERSLMSAARADTRGDR